MSKTGSSSTVSPARTYRLHDHTVTAPALTGGLHLVATPIGNLRDITLRALETLAAADVIACEDTRVTRKLLDHYGITTPLTPYHEHNAASARPKLLGRLAAGEAVARVSDADSVRKRAARWAHASGARRNPRAATGCGLPRTDQAARGGSPRRPCGAGAS